VTFTSEDRRRLTRGWLNEINPRVAQALVDSARRRSLEKGEQVYAPGDPPGGFFAVIRGGVLLSAPARDGCVRPGHISRAGQWFGFMTAITGRPRSLAAEATEPTVLAHVPAAAVDRLRLTDPEAVVMLILLNDLSMQVLYRIATDLLIRETDRRIGSVLLRVTGADDGIAADDARGVPLTHAMLAELSNSSRESVGRAMALFTERGWITARYGRVSVLDGDGLAGFVLGERDGG
jgi:CRP-like cAMP-binding protein